MNPYRRPRTDPSASYSDPAATVVPEPAPVPIWPVELVDQDDQMPGADLAQELAARPSIGWTSRATLGLAALVLLVGGFLAGAQVEKHWGVDRGSSRASSALANFAGGAGRGGAGGAGGTGGQTGGAGATTGTIKLVDGDTVYVQLANGNIVTVHAGATTTVTLPGTVAGLKAGSTVTVQGATGADGTVTATSITQAR